MSMYDSRNVYPAEYDEVYVCAEDDCENCTFDCEKKVVE